MDNLILTAAEAAETMKNAMNKQRGETYEENLWREHEATFKAMLYHQLIMNGLECYRISMENSPVAEGNKDIESKRIDIWIDEEEEDYFLEVKRVYVNPDTKGLRRVNNKNGVYGDLLKLTKIVKYHNDENTFGTVIAVYNGPDDAIDCEYIESKLKTDVKSLLNNYVRMIICAKGKCKYVKTNGT